jgi:hypothetical protein
MQNNNISLTEDNHSTDSSGDSTASAADMVFERLDDDVVKGPADAGVGLANAQWVLAEPDLDDEQVVSDANCIPMDVLEHGACFMPEDLTGRPNLEVVLLAREEEQAKRAAEAVALEVPGFLTAEVRRVSELSELSVVHIIVEVGEEHSKHVKALAHVEEIAELFDAPVVNFGRTDLRETRHGRKGRAAGERLIYTPFFAPAKRHKLAMRCEFMQDALLLRLVLTPYVVRWSDSQWFMPEDSEDVSPRVCGMDREIRFEVSTSAPHIEHLRWLLSSIVDMHVAAESLNYEEFYTEGRMSPKLIEAMAPPAQPGLELLKQLDAVEPFVRDMFDRFL